MKNHTASENFASDLDEWQNYLAETLDDCTPSEAIEILHTLQKVAFRRSLTLPALAFVTPYRNSIPAQNSKPYPGDHETEQRIENLIRWNAAAMVFQASDKRKELGGHVSTYAACATMLEVGFNHHFRKGDLLFIQGHASPGVYARAMLEGRLSIEELKNFRQETLGGVSSYPHPRSNPPNFWEAPSVSMGLGASFAVGQARFWKWLENRGLAPANGNKVWNFIGDGELDEPEIMGSALVASRDRLDNLIFVINCNLQRLDGPVRGNSKIIQDMEAAFAGLNFEVIKVVWSTDFDALLDDDTNEALQRRLDFLPDGEFQRMPSMTGDEIRELLLNSTDTDDKNEINRLLSSFTVEKIKNLFVEGRGGNDRQKIHDAYTKAKNADRPVAILIHSTKGYGLGSIAGSNKAHQKKEFSTAERVAYAERLGIPISNEQASKGEFFCPDKNSKETRYLLHMRQQLGGFIPERRVPLEAIIGQPDATIFQDFDEGNQNRSTTQDFVKLLKRLALDKTVGKQIAPIVPDEAQTFGMDDFFSHKGIGVFNPRGMDYTPQKIGMNLYCESPTGQLLQEGINEAGALATFAAAATSDAVRGVVTVPFYLFYSQFGFQRTLDSVWATADMLGRGFLMGGIAGRTTLAGEGLQHCDGASHILASVVPSVLSYDPGFSYELASIIKTGWKRMFPNGERIIYYFTMYNESYTQPARPEGVSDEEIAQGIYKFKRTNLSFPESPRLKVHLIGSGSILPEVIKAAEMLETLGIPTDIWSATSWGEVLREAQSIEVYKRGNILLPLSINFDPNPELSEAVKPLITRLFSQEEGVAIAATDFVKLLPQTIATWMPLPFSVLGTEGFGKSDSRENLRDAFEVSAKFIAHAALVLLFQKELITLDVVKNFAENWRTTNLFHKLPFTNH
jgi:pyruvate dehydrogenase E1 component